MRGGPDLPCHRHSGRSAAQLHGQIRNPAVPPRLGRVFIELFSHLIGFVLAVARADALGSGSARSFAALVRNDVVRVCWRCDARVWIDLRVTPGKQSADPGPTRRAAGGSRFLFLQSCCKDPFSANEQAPGLASRTLGDSCVCSHEAAICRDHATVIPDGLQRSCMARSGTRRLFRALGAYLSPCFDA